MRYTVNVCSWHRHQPCFAWVSAVFMAWLKIWLQQLCTWQQNKNSVRRIQDTQWRIYSQRQLTPYLLLYNTVSVWNLVTSLFCTGYLLQNLQRKYENWSCKWKSSGCKLDHLTIIKHCTCFGYLSGALILTTTYMYMYMYIYMYMYV